MNLQNRYKFETSYCQMAIDVNNDLPFQKHYIAVHACSQASSESLQRTTDRYFHTVSNWGKSNIFAKKRQSLEESNMADKDKERDKCCMHKFAWTNVTQKRRNGAHYTTHAPYCA